MGDQEGGGSGLGRRVISRWAEIEAGRGRGRCELNVEYPHSPPSFYFSPSLVTSLETGGNKFVWAFVTVNQMAVLVCTSACGAVCYNKHVCSNLIATCRNHSLKDHPTYFLPQSENRLS